MLRESRPLLGQYVPKTSGGSVAGTERHQVGRKPRIAALVEIPVRFIVGSNTGEMSRRRVGADAGLQVQDGRLKFGGAARRLGGGRPGKQRQN